MSRKEFMEKLENLLGNIQDSEREEALQYYNNYFDEAGPENENQVIVELGTPAIIKTSLQESINESGEFTERGYSDPRFVINYEVVDNHDTKEQYDYDIECGIGTIMVGTLTFGGVEGEKHIDNNSDYIMDINCGIGTIQISFENE